MSEKYVTRMEEVRNLQNRLVNEREEHAADLRKHQEKIDELDAANREVRHKNETLVNQIQRLVLPESVPKPPSPAVATAKAPPVAAPSTPVSTDNVIAPMPGQIKAILVREGDKVAEGQKLLIMEAMKLENKLPAPRTGTVKHVLVRDGDIVSQGQELIVIG